MNKDLMRILRGKNFLNTLYPFYILFIGLFLNSESFAANNELNWIKQFLNKKETSGKPTEFSYFPPDSTLTDSLKKDTLTSYDSLFLDPRAVDSTARIKNFKYNRKDSYSIDILEKEEKPWFLPKPKKGWRRSIEIDSTGEYIEIYETFAGERMKTGIKIPLEEYIKLRIEAENRSDWDKIARKYEKKAARKDLSQLITDITNIEIPLPSSKVLSIFGKPEMKLKINGAVDIYGAWKTETKEGFSTSRFGNTQSTPDFKQTVQINVDGTIGDKLTIAADWNTERDFEYQNQLKIKYTGYEDEIIQSIEAGNVSLQTSSLVGGSEALFGVKAKFQFGPFSLIALASQKKGETNEKDVSSGSTSQEFVKHAYEYSKNHFFIDEVYTSTHPDTNIFNRYYGHATPQNNAVTDFYRVVDIEVYKTLKTDYDPNEIIANAFIDLDPISSTNPIYTDENLRKTEGVNEVAGESLINTRFIMLTPNLDYTVDLQTGFITFKTQILEDEAVAVAYRIEGNPGPEDLIYGEFNNDALAAGFDSTKVRVLKLVKPKNLQPSFKKAWKLQLKNIYPIGGRNVNESGFEFNIYYERPGQEDDDNYNGQKFLEAFGLDIYDDSKTGQPDGKFDFESGRTINPETGEIIFPVLQPFGDQFPDVLPDSLKYQDVYDTLVTFAKQNKDKDKFLLKGKYSAAASSTYNIGINVVENSVKVFLGGRKLTEGVDYRVDYSFGQVTILNADALVPGANLKITYEQNDLFSMASKSLFGFRGLYEVNKLTQLGFSYLSLSQKTLSDKVRIGEEPMSNTIMGLDFKTQLEMPFVTKALDYLISTRAKSSISFDGEVAYMNPTPNTKESKIQSDGGSSIAYIDDFEGSKRIIPIGIQYNSWSDLSVPDNPSLYGSKKYSDIMKYKAKAYWYTNPAYQVLVDDIWGGRKKVAKKDQQITVLDFVFDPTKPGMYNNQPDLSDKTLTWGGFMKPLSSAATNLQEENIEFIEFWMKIDEAPNGASMYIDLGQISEDVIPNGVLDKEDLNRNQRYDDGEDVGLDGLKDSQEPGYDPVNNPDPNHDNFNRNFFSGWNGTQGNSILAELRIPDTEDLDNDGSLDLLNSYFRYKIDLDTTKVNGVFKNPYISGGGIGGKGWYQFRIPLKESVDSIGKPTLSNVDKIRIWVGGVDQPIHLKFVDMNLVGNQWQKVLVPGKVTEDDEVLTVATISYEENPEYKRPPGVEQERDRTNPDENVYKNEQSLKLSINNLEDGDKREIVKYLYRPLDVFNYKKMKLFVHGDENDIHTDNISHYIDENNYNAEVYFRFGADTLNYYEYRQPVRADWNEIEINFDVLTALKEIRDTNTVIFRQNVEGKPGHKIGVLGNPSLTKISFFIFGIVNPKDKGIPNNAISGDLWVNELRVLDADDHKGVAYKFSTSFKMADLMTVNFNMSKTDPYFHKISERFGSRTDRQSWGASVDFDVIKLIPFNMSGSNFKINYRHNESISKPLYMPGTDINVDKAAEQYENKLISQGISQDVASKKAKQMKDDTQTLNVSDTWSLSNIKIKIPSEKWYVKHTINSLSFAFNYNKSIGRTPTILHSRKWIWNFKMNYQLNFSNDNYFYPANIPVFGSIIKIFKDYRNAKIYFTPQTFSAGISASRNWSYSKNRKADVTANVQRDFRATRNFGFNWKITEGGFLNINTGYNASFQSSLAHLLTKNGVERSEKEIWNDIFSGEFFGKDYDFSQSFDFKLNPILPSFWKLNRYFSLSFSYNVSYKWRNNFSQGDLGRSASYSNRISAGMNIQLKKIFDPLFGDTGKKVVRSTSRSRKPVKKKALEEEETPPETDEEKEPIYLTTLYYLKYSIKWLLFDYDRISINFSQNNTNGGSGLLSEKTGFGNFWGGGSNPTKGPSRAFMLGLSNDIGPRVPNSQLQNQFSQNNQLTFKTSRPLWQNATIDLNWRISWGYNRSYTLDTDENGEIFIKSRNASGKLDKSFFSLPLFGSGVKKVNDLYDANSSDPAGSISSAFSEGLETLPIMAKLPILKDVAKYVPRPNWNIRWSGLEKLPLLKSFASRVSLSHSYNSSFSEGWKLTPEGIEQVQTQRIQYAFNPLIGIQLTFKKLWGGNFTGNIKFNTKTSYDLQMQTKNISESFSKDVSFSLSYSKSGFEIPMFGVALKNDIEVSLNYTKGTNKATIYEMGPGFSEEGKPQDGTVRTSMEPKVNYTLSSRVKLAVFYKRSTVETEGASKIPPTTTNEAGLEVHISIR